MQKCTIPLELGAWRGPYHAHCPSRWCRRSQRRHRPFDRKGVSDRVDELCELWDKPGQNPSTPLGYSSTTAWSPISANRGRGRGRVPDSGQIGDGDGGASPPPGKSGTDAPSPSPDKSGTGTGTGTGVSLPWPEGTRAVCTCMVPVTWRILRVPHQHAGRYPDRTTRPG